MPITSAKRVAGHQGGRTRRADSAPAQTNSQTQNAQICTVSILITIKAELVQLGGSTRAIERRGRLPHYVLLR
jgi:hypothetical protein